MEVYLWVWLCVCRNDFAVGLSVDYTESITKCIIDKAHMTKSSLSLMAVTDCTAFTRATTSMAPDP